MRPNGVLSRRHPASFILTRALLMTSSDWKAPLDPAVFVRPQSDIDSAKREEEKGIPFEFQYYKRNREDVTATDATDAAVE